MRAASSQGGYPAHLWTRPPAPGRAGRAGGAGSGACGRGAREPTRRPLTGRACGRSQVAARLVCGGAPRRAIAPPGGFAPLRTRTPDVGEECLGPSAACPASRRTSRCTSPTSGRGLARLRRRLAPAGSRCELLVPALPGTPGATVRWFVNAAGERFAAGVAPDDPTDPRRLRLSAECASQSGTGRSSDGAGRRTSSRWPASRPTSSDAPRCSRRARRGGARGSGPGRQGLNRSELWPGHVRAGRERRPCPSTGAARIAR